MKTPKFARWGRGIAGALSLTLLFSLSAAALEPYRNYTYDSEENAWVEPQAYYAADILRGSTLGTADFHKPQDVFVAPDGRVYIADTGNNRILRLSAALELEAVIDSFDNNGKADGFASPSGVFVTGEGRLYVADTDHKRLVVLEADGRLWKIMGEPDFQLDESFIYAPVRVAVDGAGRVFVVSKNVNYGMVELDKDGNFSSCYGAIQVTSSLSDLLWRRIATKAQREKMLQNVPTEYSSNAVDGDGFIYGTISTQSADQFIKKMNPMGSDVLRRMGSVDPNGDIELPDADEKPVRSVLTDICVGRGGVYSVLDTRQGRVFTYDNDGNLLYVFGALGNRNGCFVQPSAVDVLPDGTFLVADSGLNQILRFYPTEYAQKINAAVGYQYNRDYASAEASWMEVLKYTAKSELAFNEIGKAYYRQEAYTAAMKYFKLSGDRTQYSKAYKEYRRQVLNDSFSTVMTCLSVLAAGIVVLVCVRRRKGRKAGRGGVDR